jgi:type I restriction enzyme S subunit
VNELPPGWRLSKIEDLVEVGPKNDCADATAVGFIPMSHMGTRFRDAPTFEVRTWLEVKKGYTHFANGDVLVARITPCFENGKAGIPRSLPNGVGAGSTEYVVLRPKAGIVAPEFLLAVLKTERFLRDGARSMTGAVGQQRVPKSTIASYPVFTPPFDEQKRIATKIDALLGRVDSCRDRLERVPQILKQFREAVLEAAVSGRLTEAWRASTCVNVTGLQLTRDIRTRHENSKKRRSAIAKYDEVDKIREVPPSWGWIPGAAIVDPGADIVYGIVQPGPKLSEGVPYVRGMDIEDGKILTEQLLKTSEAIAKRYERASLTGGDVLLGIIRATKVAVVPNELAGANITQGTARFRPSSAIRTSYLARVLEAPATQKWLHDCYRGIDMPGLNLADVRRVPVPLPSLEEQDEITRRVDALFALGSNLEHLYETAAARVERLTPSILDKAFRGELVPQDPNDEPASLLLGRIDSERDKPSSARKESRAASKQMPTAQRGRS